MSSAWAALEALVKHGDPDGFPRCPCDDCVKSNYAGWTMDLSKTEEIRGGPLPVLFDKAVVMVRGLAAKNEKDYAIARLMPEILPALLEKNASYRIPHSAEEERRRFRQDILRFVKLYRGFRLLFVLWPDLVDNLLGPMCDETKGVSGHVYHFDPRLQLIRFPSFRFFVEVQVLRHCLCKAQRRFIERMPSVGGIVGEDAIAASNDIFRIFHAAKDCFMFYAVELGLVEDEGLVPEPIPRQPSPPTVEASSAGTSLTKAQRKHAKQKANKAAARLAKETAKATDAASSSRSDYLPMIPAPKPLTTAPKKKKASSSAGKTAGGSWAVVESGVEGGGEAQPSPKASEVEEAAAVALAPKEEEEEPPGESPQPVQAEVHPQTEALHSAPTEEPSEKVPTVKARRAALRLPVVEAVGPSGAYALLAHDLARIADRLRQSRIARSAR